jgi:hypothetical protein
MLLSSIFYPKNQMLNPGINFRNRAKIAWEMAKFWGSLGYGLLICVFSKAAWLTEA